MRNVCNIICLYTDSIIFTNIYGTAAWSFSFVPPMRLPGTATYMLLKKQLSSDNFEAK
jgi:hypothetical protein